MKGPNPFAPWSSDPEAIAGRKEETKAFSSFANAAASRQAGVMLVEGGPGTGKSELLRLFRGEAENAGLLALLVKAERNETLDSVLAKARGELAEAQKGAGGQQAGGLDAFVAEIERAARKSFGAAVLVDDFGLMRKPEEALRRVLKAAEAGWGKRRVSFVASSTRPLAAEAALLQRIELRPFGEHEARELVEKALKKGPPKMGEECLQSILADTGGNPRLFKAVCFHIYDRLRDNEKVITKGHYLAYLPQIMGTLSREWFGRMYQETPPAERAVLHALAKEEEGAHVSDVARRMRKPLGPTTALTGRLLESGQIVRVSRGRYRLFARLYARHVSGRA